METLLLTVLKWAGENPGDLSQWIVTIILCATLGIMFYKTRHNIKQTAIRDQANIKVAASEARVNEFTAASDILIRNSEAMQRQITSMDQTIGRLTERAERAEKDVDRLGSKAREAVNHTERCERELAEANEKIKQLELAMKECDCNRRIV